nr:T-cell surface glycoprotein CD8 alpha chain isoform X2 [Globicephala melas]
MSTHSGLHVTSHPPNAKSAPRPAEGRNFPGRRPTGSCAPPQLRAASGAAPRGARHGLAGDRPAPAAGPAAPCRHGPRVILVPDVAGAGAGSPGREGEAALRGAAVQHDVELLLALPEARGRLQTHLPNVPLQHAVQAGRGAGHQLHLRHQGRGRQLPPHSAPLPRGRPRLLFLLVHEQLGYVLQQFRACLLASEAHHDAGDATSHAGAHQSVADCVSAPRGVPALGGQRRHKAAGFLLRYLHLGAPGRDLRHPFPVIGHHGHLPPSEPKTRLQMSQACGQTGRQAQPFREMHLTWRRAPRDSHYKTSN